MITRNDVNHNDRKLQELYAPFADNKAEIQLTPSQLGRRWQIHPITLRRWVRDGKLHCMKLGRSVRFSLAEVERIEREGTV